MSRSAFYQTHLDRVSRSFAFCIQRLDDPFREWVGLAYLLCRIVDTVEDAQWPELRSQLEQFDRFEIFLSRSPEAREVQEWIARFPALIPEGERVLLSDAAELFGDFHRLPEPVRLSMQTTVRKMSVGMRSFVDRTAGNGGRLRLHDLADVNRYCFFVAGIVGELLTRLFVAHRPDFIPSSEFYRNSCSFGLFLQKVNLLKDQLTDEQEGRFLIHDRAEVLASLRADAVGALSYICEIPEDEVAFRVFCGWSLFLGVASLPFIESAYQNRDGSRIPREATREVLAQVEEIVQSNETMRQLFDESFPDFPAAHSSLAVETRHFPKSGEYGDEWFFALAVDPLRREDLIGLRM